MINFNSAPTRSDIQLGNNLDLNNTLLESLLSFSKNSKTLTVNDLAEHHHLRHNDSKRDNPEFRFGNLAAIGTLYVSSCFPLPPKLDSLWLHDWSLVY